MQTQETESFKIYFKEEEPKSSLPFRNLVNIFFFVNGYFSNKIGV